MCEHVCACAWCFSRCPWISDGGGAGGGNGLDGIISGWMRGLGGGMDVREGQGTPGTHSKKTKERKDEEKKLVYPPLCFPQRPVWQQLRPAYCFCISVEWKSEPWATPVPLLLYLFFPLAPSFGVSSSIRLIYVIQTNSLITFSPGYNLLVNLNPGE